MMSFDWTNVFVLIGIFVLFVFALRTDNGGLRMASHVVLMITLFAFLTPLWGGLYALFGAYHSYTGGKL